MTTHRFDRFDEQRPLPEPGDVYLTERIVYKVLRIRPIESRIWHDRWSVTLERICRRADWNYQWDVEGARVHYVVTYKKGEGPRDFERRSESEG